jgi:hypothetical protein
VTIIRTSSGALALLALLSCNSRPADEPTHRVSGQVTYVGLGIQKLHRPALVVAAFTAFPPTGPPVASVARVPTGLPGMVPYELSAVPPGAYKIVAELIDLDPATAAAAAGTSAAAAKPPVGGYPNLCVVLGVPQANVVVGDAAPVADANIQVFDQGADPCFAAVPGGMAPDAGTLDAPTPAEPDAATPAEPDAPPATAEPDAPAADALPAPAPDARPTLNDAPAADARAS